MSANGGQTEEERETEMEVGTIGVRLGMPRESYEVGDRRSTLHV